MSRRTSFCAPTHDSPTRSEVAVRHAAWILECGGKKKLCTNKASINKETLRSARMWIRIAQFRHPPQVAGRSATTARSSAASAKHPRREAVQSPAPCRACSANSPVMDGWGCRDERGARSTDASEKEHHKNKPESSRYSQPARRRARRPRPSPHTRSNCRPAGSRTSRLTCLCKVSMRACFETTGDDDSDNVVCTEKDFRMRKKGDTYK